MHTDDSLPVTELPTIWTMGHSNRTIDEFFAILEYFSIRQLVDIRRFPFSRRHPHFNGDSVARAAQQRGIEYTHLEALGGRRHQRLADSPNGAWKVEGFNAYADYMLTPEFGEALARLEGLARGKRTAFFCAEALPWRCHRRLVADALLVRNWRVLHILAQGSTCEHSLPTWAHWDGRRLTYPPEKSLF
ncbi:MAG: hypothetical protein KatS3mg110_0332 [Pirellulaceae bacterium]|nr:MAG: hypothetical protein KatS3mg110_0332 [Pirellulaceae bacterium]